MVRPVFGKVEVRGIEPLSESVTPAPLHVYSPIVVVRSRLRDGPTCQPPRQRLNSGAGGEHATVGPAN